MNIHEYVAARSPENSQGVYRPGRGLEDAEADDVARRVGIPEGSIPQARALMQNLYRAFDACDALLAEINPLILTGDDRVIALDAKFDFDPNALFRQPEIAAMRDLDEEDPADVEASKFDLAYIPLDGNIGCLVNGAGLAMATMDAIKTRSGYTPMHRRLRAGTSAVQSPAAGTPAPWPCSWPSKRCSRMPRPWHHQVSPTSSGRTRSGQEIA